MEQVVSESVSLLGSIQRGDPLAEQELVSRYWNNLKFVLERQSIDSQHVLDLCQDTFAIVIQKARKNEVKSDGSLGAFIRSVGINLLIESKRKEKRRATYATDNFDYIPDSLSSIESKVSRQHLVETVLEVIEQFNIARDRDILKWTYLEHRSKAEICEELDLSPAHYDRVIFRAKNRLKEELAEKLNIDLKTHTISDYLLSLILCSVLMTNTPGQKNCDQQMRDFPIEQHFTIEHGVDGKCEINQRKAIYET